MTQNTITQNNHDISSNRHPDFWISGIRSMILSVSHVGKIGYMAVENT